MTTPSKPNDRGALSTVRRDRIGELLRAQTSVTVAEIQREFDVSAMTARRDLAELERLGLARRTHGGAVLPSITSHEDSFSSRLDRGSQAKRALGAAAAELVAPGETVFLDTSSTAYHVAKALLDRLVPLTLISNSQPIMELVAMHPVDAVDLIGVGGQLRRLTRSFVGPLATAAVGSHFADRLFFSVKGLSLEGAMTDADPLEAEVKRAMLRHAESSVLLLDDSKIGVRGLSVIDQVDAVDLVLSHGLSADALRRLIDRDLDVTAVDQPESAA